jgi:uncharacterized protein YraI
MKVIRAVVNIAAITLLSLLMATPVLAAPAYLVGNTPGSRVNVRSGPSTASPVAHYGLVGDRVQTIDSVLGADGYYWYYVEFPSRARGWVRGDFLQVQY